MPEHIWKEHRHGVRCEECGAVSREAHQLWPCEGNYSELPNGSNTFGCVNNTIRLRSGKYFDLANPQPDQFELEDIAGALSKICRFGGQCPRFYSVAEHLVMCYRQAVADGCDIWERAAVLMHDAPEAFCGDVVKPLKNMLPEYAAIEQRIEDVIAKSLGIYFQAHADVVREIDHAMLIAERRSIFGADGVKWSGEDEVRVLTPDFRFWEPFTAEAMFMAAIKELGS